MVMVALITAGLLCISLIAIPASACNKKATMWMIVGNKNKACPSNDAWEIKCGKRRNIAFRKPTNQSSTYPAFGIYPTSHSWSRNAVDGNTNPDWYTGGSCIHTRKEPNPYWMVDLGRDSYIQKVAIVNRGQSTQNRDKNAGKGLHDLIVSVINEVGKATTFSFFKGPGKNAQKIEMERAEPVYGRYVKLQMGNGGGYLSICEVAVIGRECTMQFSV